MVAKSAQRSESSGDFRRRRCDRAHAHDIAHWRRLTPPATITSGTSTWWPTHARSRGGCRRAGPCRST